MPRPDRSDPSVRARRGDPGILMVSMWFPPVKGGSAVLFDNIYSRITDVDVTVLTDRRMSPGEDRPEGPYRIFHGPVATADAGVFPPSALWARLRLAAAMKRVNGGAPALVHCGKVLPEGLGAMLWNLVGGPKYLCWAHGEDVTSSGMSRELTALTRLVYGRAAAVIANSQNTRRLVIERGVRAEKVHVVTPGVDAERFTPRVDGTAIRRQYAPDADLVLLSVGRLQRSKGHDLAIAAVGELQHEVPRLHYVIAGDGPERGRLESMVRELGLERRVTFAGLVDEAALPAFYAASDIFVHPNRIDGGVLEGFGIVFLEAAASARPAIGGRTGGVAEAIADGVTGRLVSGTSAPELAATIRELARSAELRKQMGEAGRERVLRWFSWDRAAQAVLKIHQELSNVDRAC